MGEYRGREREARGTVKVLILGNISYNTTMPIQDDDMTTEELSAHLDAFIEEQAGILEQEIKDYNIRKASYEKDYLVV